MKISTATRNSIDLGDGWQQWIPGKQPFPKRGRQRGRIVAVSLHEDAGGRLRLNVAAVRELSLRPGMAVRLGWNASDQSILLTFSEWAAPGLHGSRLRLKGRIDQGLTVSVSSFFRQFGIDPSAHSGTFSYESFDTKRNDTKAIVISLLDGRIADQRAKRAHSATVS